MGENKCPPKNNTNIDISEYGGSLSDSAGGGRLILRQVKCPPGPGKKNIETFVRKWIPAIEEYGLDYTGIGDIFGTTSNKESKKIAIGTNRFFKINGKCGLMSDSGCRNKDKYLYLKTYPTGKIAHCKTNSDGEVSSERTNVIGGKGIIGGVLEDLSNLDVVDVVSSTVNKGPYASNNCMRARLPVGDTLLNPSKKRENEQAAKNAGSGWWIEEHCVPRQPTYTQEYGGEKFNIPFSKTFCAKPPEPFSNFEENGNENRNIKYEYIILSLLLFTLILIK